MGNQFSHVQRIFVSKYSPQTDAGSSSKPLLVHQTNVIETGETAAEDIVQESTQHRLSVAEGKTGSIEKNVAPRWPAIILAVGRTVRTKWFWYSMASSLCWTAWALTAKLGSREIPPATMEFISAFGFMLVSMGIVTVNKAQKKTSLSGRCYALLSGVLLALGGISLYGAYRTGHNASIITAITSLYPVVTFLVALVFLREKLNRVQVLGLCFAAAAIFILSF
jgi:bacterial/archaeal transporter family protein